MDYNEKVKSVIDIIKVSDDVVGIYELLKFIPPNTVSIISLVVRKDSTLPDLDVVANHLMSEIRGGDTVGMEQILTFVPDDIITLLSKIKLRGS